MSPGIEASVKILIADDDTLTRKLLVNYLQKWGYDVTAACDGAEAWRLFEAGDFPIVISDWVMPEMNGLELIRSIRASPKAECVYVVLLTSRAQKEDLVQGMEAGADDFVTKPFDRDELRVRLREGERIIRLEQSLVEQSALLREAQAALKSRDQMASLGQRAANVVPEVTRPIALVADRLGELRRDMLAALGLLNQYRAARDLLPDHKLSPAADSSKLSENLNLASLQERLIRLFDEAGEGLKQASELLQSLWELEAGQREQVPDHS